MKFRLLVSLFLIFAVTGTAFASTKALLSDQVTLTANTFSTGTVDLQINTNKTGGTFADTQVGFSDPILPGETKTEFFRLKNNGTGVDLSITGQATNIGGAINSDDVSITITPIDSSAGNGVAVGSAVTKTLTDWGKTPGVLSTPNITPGSTQRYRMDVTLSQDVTLGNSSTTFNFLFTGTQVTPTPTP